MAGAEPATLTAGRTAMIHAMYRVPTIASPSAKWTQPADAGADQRAADARAHRDAMMSAIRSYLDVMAGMNPRF